jgi:hypothetical protein
MCIGIALACGLQCKPNILSNSVRALLINADGSEHKRFVLGVLSKAQIQALQGGRRLFQQDC